MLDRIRRTLNAAHTEWAKPRFAKGGRVHQTGDPLIRLGCDYIVPRSRIAGEHGPEPIRFNQAARVYPHSSRWQG